MTMRVPCLLWYITPYSFRKSYNREPLLERNICICTCNFPPPHPLRSRVGTKMFVSAFSRKFIFSLSQKFPYEKWHKLWQCWRNYKTNHFSEKSWEWQKYPDLCGAIDKSESKSGSRSGSWYSSFESTENDMLSEIYIGKKRVSQLFIILKTVP